MMERPDTTTTASSLRKVLILDDDPSVGQTISMIGVRAGFDCRATTDAEAFFETIGAWHPTHLVVDLVLSRGDGVDVLHRLAAEGCAASVIVTSGVGVRVLEAAGRAAAENGLHLAGLLPKPFSPASLRALLAIASRDAATARHRPAAAEPTEGMLARAIAEGRLTTAYQPKLSCRDGALAGFECLARWIDPDLGVIMPDRFIGLAEKSGLIGALTLAVARQSLDWLAEAFPAGGATMAINISPAALEVPTLPAEITAECGRRGIEPERVVLEITETITMQDPLRMLELLTQFRLRGFQLAIDDFGIGYSSFTALARLPFSEIKIDKSFTMAAEASKDARKIVAAIAGVGHALGLTVTAEGVETPWAMRFLEELGCDQVQGYLVARPMDGAIARAWARRHDPAAFGASVARR